MCRGIFEKGQRGVLTGSVLISLRGVKDTFRMRLLRAVDEDFVGGGRRRVCVVLRNTWKALGYNSASSIVDDFGGRYLDLESGLISSLITQHCIM